MTTDQQAAPAARDADLSHFGYDSQLRRSLMLGDLLVYGLVFIVPIAPFAVVNYGFGLTGIPFWRYVLWTEAAMIPVNAVLILGTDAFYLVAMRGTVSWPLIAAAVAAAALVAGLAAIGLRKLGRA